MKLSDVEKQVTSGEGIARKEVVSIRWGRLLYIVLTPVAFGALVWWLRQNVYHEQRFNIFDDGIRYVSAQRAWMDSFMATTGFSGVVILAFFVAKMINESLKDLWAWITQKD